jgi:hypothetical protein
MQNEWGGDCIGFLCGSQKEKDHYKVLAVDWRIILKWILEGNWMGWYGLD